jgi:hypothetical protein
MIYAFHVTSGNTLLRTVITSSKKIMNKMMKESEEKGFKTQPFYKPAKLLILSGDGGNDIRLVE